MPKKDILSLRRIQHEAIKENQEQTQEDMKVVAAPQGVKGANFKKVLFNILNESDLYLNNLSQKFSRKTGVMISKSMLLDYMVKVCQSKNEEELMRELEQFSKERTLRSMFG